MKLKAYQLPEMEFNNLLREVLHYIKYDAPEEQHYWIADCRYGLENINKLNNEERVKLCIIATFTDVAYEKKGVACNSWSKHPLLTLSDPYMSKYVRPLDFFTAHQSEYNHNVFFVGNTYNVM